ncbi:MAG TPA: DUF4907 domain-containing protein [Candidatus Bacteroides pullicola]|uniref:DUF4907 domain-containing protein n=1 Tax=Candidatus Bacteroides pullicola TaxID=2838475 RepID=A0A9D2CKV5_9BACE|nr:DUF4907 domain-containing protein [Candidatus Bacteroides pullicola]
MKTTLLVLVGTGALLVLAACLSGCSSREEPHCRTFPVPGGYGYAILYQRDTLIKQPYMPAIGGRQPFRTAREAQAIGELVCRKLHEGHPPTLTPEEVADKME